MKGPAMPQIHYRACHLCEAACGIAVEHADGRVLTIRGDRDDPFSRGYICPKAMGLKDVHEDPDRIRRPLRRRGNDFEEVSWEVAFDEVAARVLEVCRIHGRDAVALYFGNPVAHNYGSLTHGYLLFARALGTRARYSATSVDQLPHMLASFLMFGNQLLLPVPDIDRARHMLILGANPAVSNGSIMTAPGVARRLEALRARGGRLIVVDPRRTETAALADEHHFIRPGRDAALLLGVLHTLFAEGLARPGRLADMLDGEGALRELVRRFPPERVAVATGIAAADVRRIAREFAASPAAVCYGRLGTTVQEFGGLTAWLITVLNIVTGNLDRPGGAMFTTPAADPMPLSSWTGMRGSFDAYRTRVRGLPEFGGELPVATLAEEIETPGSGQIRALITCAGNPVLSVPNGTRLERALASLDVMVSVDIYVNETTRHAHYILPPTFGLEHDNYDLALNAVAVRNVAKWSPALFAPAPGALHDWQIFLELTRRVALPSRGALGRAAEPLVTALASRLTPETIVDALIRLGRYGDRYNPLSRGLNLRKVKESVHGLDLGPLEPRLPDLLQTPRKRIHLAPPELLADVARFERRLAEDERATRDGSLVLIGRRQLRSNNSWLHNSVRLVKGPERCTLLMHPDDARARGLEGARRARVRSRAGSVVVPLELSNEVMRGVVSLPHGWGHAREGVKLAVAREHAGTSVNDLTDETRVDALSGTASVNGVPVEVTAVE